MELWLSVIDYAVVKKVSVSTLRRRIKSQLLETKFENGKYLIRVSSDEMEPNQGGSQFSSTSTSNEKDQIDSITTREQATIQTLIQEIKSAYSQILSDKEEMISQLKSEIDILKHINQFLEKQIMNLPLSNTNQKSNSEFL